MTASNSTQSEQLITLELLTDSCSEEETPRFELRTKSQRRIFKYLAERLWENGYRPISRRVRDGYSTCLDDQIAVMLSGESDEVMREMADTIVESMPETIFNESKNYTKGNLTVVINNKY